MSENTAVIEEEKEAGTPNSTGRTGTTSGELASYFEPYFIPSTYSHLLRQAKTHLLMGSSCGIWLSYIVLSEHVAQATAWVFLLGCLMVSSLSRWLSVRQELYFRLEPRYRDKVADFPDQPVSNSLKENDDRELEELAAPIIAFISIAIPLALLASYLIFHIDLTRLHKPVLQRQIVEIELVAPSDAIDRSDILPATSKEIASKAQKGALYTVASQALTGAATPRAEPSIKANIRETVPVEDKPTGKNKSIAHREITLTKENEAESTVKASSIAKAEQTASSKVLPLSFKAPDNWKTIVVSKEKDNSIAFSTYAATAQATTYTATQKATTQAAPIADRAVLSEVEPASMIESIDSDGQPTPLTIQIGGRSNSGKGAPSNLHEYLKLLNKKVKSHWIPPRGTDRIAIIEFRISADGKLVSTRALRARGHTDVEAEAAAISAITKSFPFKPLPPEVKAANLDVRYTFNYHFNQIDEVSSYQ